MAKILVKAQEGAKVDWNKAAQVGFTYLQNILQNQSALNTQKQLLKAQKKASDSYARYQARQTAANQVASWLKSQNTAFANGETDAQVGDIAAQQMVQRIAQQLAQPYLQANNEIMQNYQPKLEEPKLDLSSVFKQA